MTRITSVILYFLLMILPLFSCEDKGFNTQINIFSGNYSTLAHHQTRLNADIIENLSRSVARWFPHTSHEPINILDLCCGHGEPTYNLLVKLREKGVQVSEMTGYDISSELINQATATYAHEPKLEFFVRNAESFVTEEPYDLVVSFFGFHWMKDLGKTALSISNALKPNGKIMFFVPLEPMDLFPFRKIFLRESRWSSYFDKYELHPIIGDEHPYISAFNQYFNPETEETKRSTHHLLHEEEGFISFLSSWIQEFRYLQKKIVDNPEIECRQYVREMIASIPKNLQGGVCRQDNGRVLFTDFFFSYQGSLNQNFKNIK